MPAAGPGLIDDVAAAGLRGRGGASFPTGGQAAQRRGAPRLAARVLVNGAEGEPMSAKDRVLLSAAPHLVLDGALAAAEAIGARSVVVAVPSDAAARARRPARAPSPSAARASRRGRAGARSRTSRARRPR